MARAETNFLQTVLAHEENGTTQYWSFHSQCSVCRTDYHYFPVAKPTVSPWDNQTPQLSSSLLDFTSYGYLVLPKTATAGSSYFNVFCSEALKLNSLLHCGTNQLGSALTYLPCIQDMPGSNPGEGHTVICFGHFRLPLQAKMRIEPSNKTAVGDLEVVLVFWGVTPCGLVEVN
jgi:hypothetical protein